MLFVFFKILCGYKLFSCLILDRSFPLVIYTLFLRVLTSRLRGSDNGERFVIPAEAGIQLLLCNDHKKYSSLRILKSHVK